MAPLVLSRITCGGGWPFASLLRTAVTSAASGQRQASTVGFIGLGNMGSGMATNLLQKGHKVVVFDVIPESLAALESLGAKKASNVKEVAQQCQEIVTMLPTNETVEDVFIGSGGVMSTAAEATLLIDCSTVNPEVSMKMSKEAEKRKLCFIDAPVSGGVNAAKAGTLTFMIGGSDEDVSRGKELLKDMGKATIHCGPAGCGSAAKICNNMMLAIAMIGHSEAMNLGMRLGLDPKLLNHILNVSSGKTWVSDVYSPVPGVMENVPSSNGTYKGGFGCSLVLKDLKISQEAARQVQAITPFGGLAAQFYQLLCSQGHSSKDFGYIFQYVAANSSNQST